MGPFGEKWLTRSWSLPGFGAFMCYLGITAAVLAALLFDAASVFKTATLIDMKSVARYAANSVAIGVPAAVACVTAAMYLAYRLRFVAMRHAMLAVIALLTPYFSSAVGLYVGLKALFGASPLAFGLGLVIRYLPICTIILLLAMQQVPGGIRRAALNLQVSRVKLFWRVVLPIVSAPMLLLLVLVALLMPLDVIGSTVAGGGQLQTFGNLIADYARTRDLQGVASLLTALFVGVATLLLIAFVNIGVRTSQRPFRAASSELLADEPLRTVYLNPVFIAFVGFYLAVLLTLLRERPRVGSQLSDLSAALWVSAGIVGPITVVTVIVALFVGCWLHLSDLRHAPTRERFVLAALVVPTLLPPILAGRLGAVTQGLLNISGSGLSVAAWYVYFFGAIPILVVVSHPLVEGNVLAHVAANHRVNASDYVLGILLPALGYALMVGGCLFGAIAMSDAVIVRYIGGSTKTLGLVLADHQAGVLSPGDYVFLGGLGLWTLAALLLVGILMFASKRKASHRVGEQLPTPATRGS
jgi:ABC-type spermidine/putrescine transport system permease subunit II